MTSSSSLGKTPKGLSRISLMSSTSKLKSSFLKVCTPLRAKVILLYLRADFFSLVMNIPAQSQPKTNLPSSVEAEQFLFRIAIHSSPYVIFHFSLWEGLISDIVKFIIDQRCTNGLHASREISIVPKDVSMTEKKTEGKDYPHDEKQSEESLNPKRCVFVLQGTFRNPKEMLLNLHIYYKYTPSPPMLRSPHQDQFLPPPQLNRYRIPPDFDMVELHHQAALVYDIRGQHGEVCPCCNRRVGTKKIPICSGTASFLRISPEIPLYFSYVKVVTVILLLYTGGLIAQRMFSPTIQTVSFKFTSPENNKVYDIQIGFIELRREIRFLYFMLFTGLILFVRGYLKKSKYQVKNLSKKLSDRSVMLTNVPRNASIKDIKEKFKDYPIENVQLTFRVRDYVQSLKAVYRLKKTCFMAKKRGKSKSYVTSINKEISSKTDQIKGIKSTLRSSENRLDFVFVTFSDQPSRDQFLKKYQRGLFSRLFFKFCTCCSPTAIKGQHISVWAGPDAQDIDWLQLESDYWVKKTHRFACYYMSFAILIFGALLQYQISTFPEDSLLISIGKNLVVLIGNFLVVNLLQFTTFQVEKHELNTNKVLSLIKKLTFFVFLNLSMSPLSIYLYQQFAATTSSSTTTTPFDQLALSVLIITIGNISKPLTQYLNIGRVVKRFSFLYQRFLQDDCQMAQAEANAEYQPITFPLASFYSLLLSALYLTAFFLSSFQAIIAVEVLSCLVLYGISKYMLLRICREPIGLNHAISVLCQRMVILCIPLYWLGEKLMYFIRIDQPQGTTLDIYLQNLLQVYTIAEMGVIVVVILFSSALLARVSKQAMTDKEITESFLQRANHNHNAMNYADVNSVKGLEQELKRYIDSV